MPGGAVMSRRYAVKRVALESRGRITLQDLAELVEMACRADMPGTTPVLTELGGTRLDRYTITLEVRCDVP
jgi:hypothetical protein